LIDRSASSARRRRFSIWSELACSGPQRRQILIDRGVGYRHFAVDLAFAQALHDYLVADVVAILGIRNVLLRQRLAELLGRKLVVLSDALNRALDLAIVDLDTALLGLLQQRALGDQALEHLFVEHVGRRRLHFLLPQLLLHDPPCVVELVLGQGLVIDDSDDAVDATTVGGAFVGCAQTPASASAIRDEANIHDLAFRLRK
jgi:hypothetical protein